MGEKHRHKPYRMRRVPDFTRRPTAKEILAQIRLEKELLREKVGCRPMSSDTPRTDKAEVCPMSIPRHTLAVDSALARTMEREITAYKHMNLTILYSCDRWHSQESKFLHGVFSDRLNALEAIEELDPGKLTAEQRDLFFKIGQTQGYEGHGEWMTEEVTLDEISCRLE